MSGFDIPEVSCFARDPAFWREPQTWNGTQPEVTAKKPRLPKIPKVKREPKPRTGGQSGGRPVSVFVDLADMHAFREEGHSWKECGSQFGCTGEHARMMCLKAYPETTRYTKGPSTAKRQDLKTHLFQEAYDRLKSYKKVAAEFGCCMGTVYYRLKRSNEMR